MTNEHLLLDSVQRKGDNLLQKQEQEEMQIVCEVMEDLIRMQGSIFIVSLQLVLSNQIIVLCSHELM